MKPTTILYLYLGLFLATCTTKKEESSVTVQFAHEKVLERLDYTSCLEKNKQLFKDANIQKITRKNPWLETEDINSIAAFYNVINEHTFLDRQANVECKKQINETTSYYDLHGSYGKQLAIYADKKQFTLEDQDLEKLRYTIDMYNKGVLSKSAAFRLSKNGVDYEFVVVAQFPEKTKSEIQSVQEHNLKIKRASNEISLDIKVSEIFCLLDYYLIAIENPCTPKETKTKPILIEKDIFVSYYVKK
ncbi:hypothetical protein BKI52_30455 [marine bacterium AO1-C]|nr:hypothetical protein BKI52_30455 [marine bacterium AO1-C]